MGSGNKRLVMNTRERALSGDINRLQAFHESDLAQVLWEMFGRYSAADDVAPGVETDPQPAAIPPYAGILNGLRPYPVNGTLNLLVTPGTAMVENPAPTPDDNAFKFIRDPGVTAVGALTLTPGGADVRIDILECQPVDAILETDNRDIFNNGTGVFAPAAVTKVMAGRMQYRIRIGVEGGGFPNVVAGWVPLMVARVPAGAVDWDACDLWDVRPLVSEKWNAPFDTRNTFADLETHLYAEETVAGAAKKLKLRGWWKGTWKGQRIDGGTVANYLDISDTTTNQSPAFAPLGSGIPWGVWLAFPFGLPGWRRYSAAPASPRQPYGMRGIPVVSSVGADAGRSPLAVVVLPTATGLGGNTTDAVLLCAGTVDSGGNIRGFTIDGHQCLHVAPGSAINQDASDPLGTGISSSTILAGISFPRCASSVLLELTLTMTGAGAAAAAIPTKLVPLIDVLGPAGFVACRVNPSTACSLVMNGGTSCTWKLVVEVPVTALGNLQLQVTWGVWSSYIFTAVTADTYKVIGWKL